MRIAAIDQGTTSTRALTVDSNGQVKVVNSVTHRQSYPREGWVEHDPEELIRNIQACADAVGLVDALGIDNQGESCLAWDSQTKQALTPVIVWQDSRTIGTIEALKADGVETDVQARCGLPLDPYFSAAKLGWIVKNVPEARDALSRGTLRLGTTDAFFLDRLTGRFVSDVSTASRTSLMNLETQQWDETLCGFFNVPIETLPEIVPTTGDFGAMKTQHGSIPVTASIVDQQAALYGFGCRNKGEAKVTFGTGVFALMVTGEEILRKFELGLLPTVAWQKSGQSAVFAVDGGVYTASAAINWARSLGLFCEFSEINSFDHPPAIESGLAFVPALSGLGCPHWEPRARGVWLGLSLEHKPEQLVQSILEGVAFRTAEVLRAMDHCVPLTGSLFVDGGMSQNPYFIQFLSNTLSREICPAKMPELTGLGAMSLAADFIGHDLETSPQFGSYRPERETYSFMKKFEQAVAVSRQW